MLLDGMAISTGGAVGIATNNRGYVGTASTSSYGESVSCRRAMTLAESCEVRAAQASLRVKYGFSEGWRNILIGVGYVVYILPGVVLYFVFDNQSDNAAEEAQRAANAERERCLRGIW